MIEAQISMGKCPPTFYNAILDNLYGGNGEISALAQSNLNWSMGKRQILTWRKDLLLTWGKNNFLDRNYDSF